MAQDQKHKNPIRQEPRQDKKNAGLNEMTGPEHHQSDMDDPEPRHENPGHANPAHNTPGHPREDQARQQDAGEPGQGGTQSYPGIKGPETLALQEDPVINSEEAKEVIKKP